MQPIGKMLLVWASVCAVGFGAFQFWQPADFNSTVMLVWTPLALAGIAGMLALVPGGLTHPVVKVWTGLVTLGMLSNYAVAFNLAPSPHGLFFPLSWAVIFAAGFAYSSTDSDDTRNLYRAAAGANALLALSWLVPVPGVIAFTVQNQFLLLAATSALPLAYDALKHRR